MVTSDWKSHVQAQGELGWTQATTWLVGVALGRAGPGRGCAARQDELLLSSRSLAGRALGTAMSSGCSPATGQPLTAPPNPEPQ